MNVIYYIKGYTIYKVGYMVYYSVGRRRCVRINKNPMKHEVEYTKPLTSVLCKKIRKGTFSIMYRKTRKLLAVVLTLAMMLTAMAFTTVASAATGTALTGTDRYATAIKIAKQGWTQSDTVVIARGDELADALSAASLNAPILLTETGKLPTGVLDEVKALAPKTIYIVGGTGAVSTDVETALKAVAPVTRLWGTDRVATSVEVAKKVSSPSAYVLASATSYADALSVSPVAAAKGMPVLLVLNNKLSDAEKTLISGKTVYAVGGTGVISDAVVTAASATRVAGANRYETNAAILKQFAPDYSKIYLARGTDKNLVDALAGSTLAAKGSNPIVLVDGTDTLNSKVSDVIKANVKSDSAEVLLGAVTSKAADAVEALKPQDLVVSSVTPINAKELTMTFNQAVKKSSIIDTTTNTLVDNVVKVDGAYANSFKASLSSDGKVVTITSDSTWVGTHSVEVIADTVQTEAGIKVQHYATAFSFSDTTRASITGVTFVGKYIYKVNFSEPVQDPGTVTAKLADGTTVTLLATSGLAADGKSYNVYFDPATTPADKEITVSFGALEDFAGNYSTPLTAKITVSSSDTTKPAVVSVTATSHTTLKVKFAESITLEDATLVTFNGTHTNVTAVVDSDDDTILDVTVPSTTTVGVLAIGAGTVKDLSLNPNAAYSKTVSFTADTVAPQVSSYKVVDNSGVNELDVTFTEDVVKAGTSALTLKYTDTYGVAKSVTVPNTSVTVDSTDNTLVKIDLTGVKEDVNYSVTIPAGFFTDEFLNDSVEKTISFLNSSTATTSKLALISGTPIVTTDAIGGTADRASTGAFVDVQFADAVDVASATNTANYAVEGATVAKASLVYNDPTTATANGAKAVVRVYITDNTVEASGWYNVTVSGVKGYSSAVTVMDSTTKNIQIVENVRPTVSSVTINSFNSTTPSTVVTLTFSKAISHGTLTNGNFDLYVAGVKVTSATVTGSALGTSITYTINQDLSDELAAGKEVKLVATSAFDLVDSDYNLANVTNVIIK